MEVCTKVVTRHLMPRRKVSKEKKEEKKDDDVETDSSASTQVSDNEFNCDQLIIEPLLSPPPSPRSSATPSQPSIFFGSFTMKAEECQFPEDLYDPSDLRAVSWIPKSLRS